MDVNLEPENVMSIIFPNSLSNEDSEMIIQEIGPKDSSIKSYSEVIFNKHKIEDYSTTNLMYEIGYEKMHTINSIAIQIRLPGIKVKTENYRISWTPYVCHSIIESAIMRINFLEKDYIEHSHLNYHVNNKINSFDLRKTDSKNYENCIGNKDNLIDYSNELKEEYLCVGQFWNFFTSKSPFPLLYHEKGVTFDYFFNLNIKKLLRIKERIGDKWVNKNPSEFDFTELIIEKSEKNNYLIDKPQMKIYGRKFVQNTNDYFSFYTKECFKDENGGYTKRRSIHYYDYSITSSKNPVQSGRKKKIDIQDNSFKGKKVVELSWMAENIKSNQYNNRNNYTNNFDDIREGSYPISISDIKIGSNEISLTNDMFAWLYMGKSYGIPRVNGYHKLNLSLEDNSIDIQPGFISSDNLTCNINISIGEQTIGNKLGLNSRYDSETSKTSDMSVISVNEKFHSRESDIYNLVVIIKYMKKIVYFLDDKEKVNFLIK